MSGDACEDERFRRTVDGEVDAGDIDNLRAWLVKVLKIFKAQKWFVKRFNICLHVSLRAHDCNHPPFDSRLTSDNTAVLLLGEFLSQIP